MADEIVLQYLKELAEHSRPEQLASHYRAKQHGSPLSALFEGELAYHAQEFTKALQCYLQARQLAHSPYFCYRAAALIHWERGEKEEARAKAQQALLHFPKDPHLLKITRSKQVHELRTIFTPPELSKELFAQEPAKATQEAPTTPLSLEQILKRNSIRQKEWIASLLENSIETAPYRLSCFGQCQLDDYLVRLLPGSPPSTYMLTSENTTLVLNPGRGFLRQFLENGSRLEALNAILLTRGDILSLGDTLALLRLKAAAEQESQISVFAPPVLLHRIQANLTAAESECIKTLPLPTEGSKKQTLSNELSFEIFTPPHAATAEGALYRYGLKIHLHTPSTLTTIGFSSGLNFSKELASLLSGVDILIAGIGKTTSTEVSQGTFLPDCLGYTGAKHLIEKIKPKVAFLDELCGSFGDVRLEVTRQMRQDLGEKAAILPSSPGMTFDLKRGLIQATDKEEFIDPKMTRVVRGAPSSMRLHYASCCDIL